MAEKAARPAKEIDLTVLSTLPPLSLPLLLMSSFCILNSADSRHDSEMGSTEEAPVAVFFCSLSFVA